MEMNSKFNLNDVVFYIAGNKVLSNTIATVTITISVTHSETINTQSTYYRLRGVDNVFTDENLFCSKEELLKTL